MSEHKQGEQQAEGEADSLPSREPDVGLDPRPWDHDLNRRQMLKGQSLSGTPVAHSCIGTINGKTVPHS